MKQSHHSPITFQELAEKLDQFDSDRQWLNQDPADLAKSIMIESAELLELFQRDNTIKNRGEEIPEKNIDDIKNEVADILIYLMKFCREMNIDIVDATNKKLDKVKVKYPANYKENGGHEEYLRIKKEYRNKK